ncbi:hypothetical protein BT67DRAFT_433756 [Trichocladium antarcticum]|uniref:Uncharacterized protein n=1 Tax=Trichocladium antarcticum TaxID=1450529 RepID=A0AAN6ZEW6_9PEZI|nr:hypothetical protein BT67DRAFT_433756 [Trichocladium antarcticum]
MAHRHPRSPTGPRPPSPSPPPFNLYPPEPDELVTDIQFITPSGNFTVPNALITPRYAQSWIPVHVARAVNQDMVELQQHETAHHLTARRHILVGFELGLLPGVPLLVRASVMEEPHGPVAGVSIILGRPFIERLCGGVERWMFLLHQRRQALDPRSPPRNAPEADNAFHLSPPTPAPTAASMPAIVVGTDSLATPDPDMRTAESDS